MLQGENAARIEPHLKKDKRIEHHRVGFLCYISQVSSALITATLIQGVKLLVTITVGAAGRICCTEEAGVLGGVTDDTFTVSSVTQRHLSCIDQKMGCILSQRLLAKSKQGAI